MRRNWPFRAGRRIGGCANWQVNLANPGDSVTMQQAAWNAIKATVDPTDFPNSVAIGELGINDSAYRNTNTAACTWTTSSTTVTINSQTASQISAGQVVTGTGIPANTTVVSVTWSGVTQTSFVLSATPTQAGTSGTLTFTCNAASVQTALTNLWNSMLSAGVKKVIAMTVPLGAATSLSSFSQAIVNAVNTWMRTPGNLPSGVSLCDNAADTRLSAGAPSGYQTNDGLHWTDAGYGVYAQNAAFGTNATSAPTAVGAASLASALGITAAPTSISGTFGAFTSHGQFTGNFGLFAA
jgi:hypothetical protein